ncbi:hypothetical protein [Pseudomonas sp. MWU12-2323]|uniref:hypothetical protein n=1 Tax=Pseudomonas sp. MWU12-2323 TaxID=2651296 RepID=UPI00128BBCC0|nr:hypothetical protein [Pseudomonas sp. MWU12-2323]MPQ69481.1 hypothetical protein [Pseudomonas sp. MWU12-2323]
MLEALAAKLGFVRLHAIKKPRQFAHSVGKRLDEHRELVEQIGSSTDLFAKTPWHINHMAPQDDYLMRLFFMVHGCWPDDHADRKKVFLTGEHVRARPAILGACGLPEYQACHH